jgi:DNA polymerase-3 subunit delta
MKIKGNDVESFLGSFGEDIAGILLYGPDTGLVHERADRVVATVAGDASDPFRVSELTPDRLQDQPTILADEGAALTFGGGRRVLRLRPAGDKQTVAIASFLKASTGGLLVAEGGDLGPRSSLRTLFETAKNAAALPCYRDEGGNLERFVVDELSRHGLQAADEAREYLARMLGGDRAVTRRELEKLATYVGPSSAGRSISLAEVTACVGDSAALTVEDLVFAVGDGDLATVDRLTDRVLAEGTSPVGVLRAAARHFLRLHLLAAADGDREVLIRALKPPVIFKRHAALYEQFRRWPPVRLRQAITRLTRAELDCKSTRAPAEALCRRTLMELAAHAPRRSRPVRSNL